ncbi:26123_t:CDS:2, partial [Gigaspora margarita]
ANNDDFDPFDNDEEKNSNNNDEILASTSTSTSNLSYNLEEKVEKFKMPCVSTIKTIIFDSYTSAIKQIIDLILETSGTVSLTFDIWFSRAHDSYIGITCYWLTESFESHKIILEIGELDDHYASDIVESVNSVFDKFKINNQKIFSITTDNGTNVKLAVQQIGITNVKCAGHTLQLSVNLGLKQVDGLISKCKALVSILSKEKKRKQLCEAQLQINPELKEPLDVIKDKRSRDDKLFSSFRRRIRIIGRTLSLFDKAIQFLSGFKYPTLGFMIPMLEELAHQLKYFTSHNKEAIFVRDTILDNLIERWGDPSEIGMCCSFLDPRFKQLNFCTRDLRRSTIQIMRHQFDELNSTQTTNNDTTPANNNNTISNQFKKPKMSVFFSHLRTENTNTVSNEFDRYCELPEISLDEEPCPL